VYVEFQSTAPFFLCPLLLPQTHPPPIILFPSPTQTLPCPPLQPKLSTTFNPNNHIFPNRHCTPEIVWNAGQLNQLPRALTIRIVALRIIELIATRQIPVPDQSSCLLGAARVYYKLTVHLKKDAQYLSDSMLSIDFIQRRIDQHNIKIQQQANNKITSGGATASKVKRGLIHPVKKTTTTTIPSSGPSPSTTQISSGSDVPETTTSIFEDSSAFVNFDHLNIPRGLDDHQFNYDFDYLNQDHRDELLGALNDVEKRGEAELGYLYNMGHQLKGQEQSPPQADPQQQLQSHGGPANLFNQSANDFLGQYDAVAQLEALDDGSAFGMDFPGYDQYDPTFGNSFLSRSIGSNAVVVRDQHGNVVDQSRLSLASPMGQGKNQNQQFDMDFGQGNVNARDYSHFGGLDFDDFSSSQGNVPLDPFTGLPLEDQQQQQRTQQQPQQSQQGVNPSAFSGLNEFLFNVVVGDQPRDGLLQQEDEVLIQPQKQRKIRKAAVAGDDDTADAPRSSQRLATKQQSQQKKEDGDDDEEGEEQRGKRVAAKRAKILTSGAKKSAQRLPNAARVVNPNDIDPQISLNAPEFNQDQNQIEDGEFQQQQQQHRGQDDLYGFDHIDLYSAGNLSQSSRHHDHFLSSESSTVMVRDFHPDQAGGRHQIGRVAKFAFNNSFANPVALSSPFKSPKVPLAIQLPQSQFTPNAFDLPSDISSDHQQSSQPFQKFEGGSSTGQQQQQQQLYDHQLSLAQPLHQQEEFNFSFLSSNSLAFSRAAASTFQQGTNNLTFINDAATTNQASVTELFDIISEAHPKMVPTIVNAQRSKVQYQETTISLSAPNQHKLQLIAALQPTLLQDLSESLPLTTLTAIDQQQNNYDGFGSFGDFGIDGEIGDDNDIDGSYNNNDGYGPSAHNLTQASKRSRLSIQSIMSSKTTNSKYRNNRHNSTKLGQINTTMGDYDDHDDDQLQ
jgi:hypothetical protein